MVKYPQTPVELVAEAVEEAKRKGAAPGLVDPFVVMAEKGQWRALDAGVQDAFRHRPEPLANLRSKISWARNWANGKMPGTKASDLSGDVSEEVLRHAWLEVISGGKYNPTEQVDMPVVSTPESPDGLQHSDPSSNVKGTQVLPDPQKATAGDETLHSDPSPVAQKPEKPAPALHHSDPTSQQPAPETDQSAPQERPKAEVTETDDYADIQDAIDKGIL